MFFYIILLLSILRYYSTGDQPLYSCSSIILLITWFPQYFYIVLLSSPILHLLIYITINKYNTCFQFNKRFCHECSNSLSSQTVHPHLNQRGDYGWIQISGHADSQTKQVHSQPCRGLSKSTVHESTRELMYSLQTSGESAASANLTIVCWLNFLQDVVFKLWIEEEHKTYEYAKHESMMRCYTHCVKAMSYTKNNSTKYID